MDDISQVQGPALGTEMQSDPKVAGWLPEAMPPVRGSHRAPEENVSGAKTVRAHPQQKRRLLPWAFI